MEVILRTSQLLEVGEKSHELRGCCPSIYSQPTTHPVMHISLVFSYLIKLRQYDGHISSRRRNLQEGGPTFNKGDCPSLLNFIAFTRTIYCRFVNKVTNESTWTEIECFCCLSNHQMTRIPRSLHVNLCNNPQIYKSLFEIFKHQFGR